MFYSVNAWDASEKRITPDLIEQEILENICNYYENDGKS